VFIHQEIRVTLLATESLRVEKLPRELQSVQSLVTDYTAVQGSFALCLHSPESNRRQQAFGETTGGRSDKNG